VFAELSARGGVALRRIAAPSSTFFWVSHFGRSVSAPTVARLASYGRKGGGLDYFPLIAVMIAIKQSGSSTFSSSRLSRKEQTKDTSEDE
jgi:hypothetical protein